MGMSFCLMSWSSRGTDSMSPTVYGCSGVAVEVPGHGLFDDLSGIHDMTLSAYRATMPRLWVMMIRAVPWSRVRSFHELQELGLDGHVQGRGGLIGNDEPGVAGQPHGDHGPLPHAAAELVGKGVDPGSRHRGSAPSSAARCIPGAPPSCSCPCGASEAP